MKVETGRSILEGFVWLSKSIRKITPGSAVVTTRRYRFSRRHSYIASKHSRPCQKTTVIYRTGQSNDVGSAIS